MVPHAESTIMGQNSDVGQRRRGGNIADGKNARDVCQAVVPSFNITAFIKADADRFEPNVLRIRHPAERRKNPVAAKLFFLAALVDAYRGTAVPRRSNVASMARDNRSMSKS